MRKLFASNSRTAGRGRADNARLTGSSVRPLRAETDQAVCSRLNEIFSAAENASVSRSYYAFDAHYIVVARRERNTRMFSTAFLPVVIFDRELKAVDILAI